MTSVTNCTERIDAKYAVSMCQSGIAQINTIEPCALYDVNQTNYTIRTMQTTQQFVIYNDS